MRKRVLIVGGGVSGLLCSYVFRRKRKSEVYVLEPKALGGEFLAGGLKYIHHTDEMVDLFDELDIQYSNYSIRGGILLRGKVHPYPACFQGMAGEDAQRIQADHYRKTRKAEPGADAKTAMNDPASTKPKNTLRCHFPDMIKALSRRAHVHPAGLLKVEKNTALLTDGRTLEFDYLVLTIPLWIIKGCVRFFVPHGMAMRLNVARVKPTKDKYAKWDYVYTPYTPAGAIHRFSPSASDYVAEVNGDLDRSKLDSDLNFIFPEGWSLVDLKEGLKGHLLPLKNEAAWPANIAPLGRFAKWDSRATMDVTLMDVYALHERWFG